MFFSKSVAPGIYNLFYEMITHQIIFMQQKNGSDRLRNITQVWFSRCIITVCSEIKILHPSGKLLKTWIVKGEVKLWYILK